MARLVEVIATSECRGEGTEQNRYRTVTQLWTKDGNLIAESDTGPTGENLGNPYIERLLHGN